MRWDDIFIKDPKTGQWISSMVARDWVNAAHPSFVFPHDVPTVILRSTDGTYASYDPWVVELLQSRLGGVEMQFRTPVADSGATDSSAAIRRSSPNVLDSKAIYKITLSLGDLNAIFEPIPPEAVAEPWKCKGVQQRLQALGYLYTPLGHSKIERSAEACWEYYRRVHKVGDGGDRKADGKETPDNKAGDGPALASPGASAGGSVSASASASVSVSVSPKPSAKDVHAALLALLEKEIYGNIVTAALPKSGQVLPLSELPRVGTFGALRFPGGYAVNYPRPGGTKAPGGKDSWIVDPEQKSREPLDRPVDADAKYDFALYDDQYKIADAVALDNPYLGKIPIIARVERLGADSKMGSEPVKDAEVYFRLVEPERPEGRHPLWAPDLRDTVMDYATDPEAIKVWQTLPPDLADTDEKAAPSAPSDADAPPAPPADDADVKKLVVTPEVWMRAKLKARKIYQATSEACAGDVKRAETEKDLATAAEDKARKERMVLEAQRQETYKLHTAWMAEKMAAKPEKRDLDAANVALERLPEFNEVLYQREVDKAQKAAKASAVAKPSAAGTSSAADKPSVPDRKDDSKEKIIAMERVRAARLTASAQVDERQAAYNLAEAKTAEESPHRVDLASRTAASDAKSKEADAARAAATSASSRATQLVPEEARRRAGAELGDDVKGEPGAGAEQRALKRSVDYILAGTGGTASRDSPLFKYLLSADGTGEIKGGPKQFVDRVIAGLEGNRADPQRRNAPALYAGKAGVPVAGNIFEIVSRPRFTDAHARLGALPRAAAAGAAHPHAVVARTNAEGYAGVVFMPSRCGGDTYRLKAYLSPDVDAGQASTETGTLVLWRNIRMARYFQKQTVAKGALSKPVKALIDWHTENKVEDAKVLYNGKTSWDPVYEHSFFSSNVVTLNFGGAGWQPEPTYAATDSAKSHGAYRPVAVDFISFAEQFNRCWCEVVMDTGAVEELPSELHRRALDAGIAAVKGEVDKAIDWETLIFHDPASPYLVNLRHVRHYNALIQADSSKSGKYPLLGNHDESVIKNAFDPGPGANAMLATFAGGDGFFPGFTLVQAPRGDSWDQHCISAVPLFSSGLAAPSRSAFIFYTEGVHRSLKFSYSATSNAVHEIGHVLMGEHQEPNPGGDKHKHQPQPKVGTRPAEGEDACVMGYMGCYGQFCGRCVLRLRGWKTKSIRTPAGV